MKVYTAFGLLFFSSFAALYAVTQSIQGKSDKILESRRRIAEASLEETGKSGETKVWYYTKEFKEYRRKKEAEEAERKRQQLNKT